jgi:hypothetical protein
MERKRISLPNGQITMTDGDGFITADVFVSVDELIDRDGEGVLDLLSERATGSPLLTSISFHPLYAEGRDIFMRVRGQVDMLLEAEGDDA